MKKSKDSVGIQRINNIIKENKGYITSKEVTAAGIPREYLKILEERNEIAKISRGIYISNKYNIFEDSYYALQLKHKNVVFSHFTSLSFKNFTEVVPYRPEITIIIGNYRKEFKDYQVFYVKDKELLDLGKEVIKSNFGNDIYVYNLERTICDIIRSIGREDMEQVKKAIKNTVNKLDMIKIKKYSNIMGISNKVSDYIGRYVE